MVAREIQTELPTRSLALIDFSDQSIETYRQRQVFFGHLYGPAGMKYRRGVSDGSIKRTDLGIYRDGIDAHFFNTISFTHSLPHDITPRLHYTLMQQAARGVKKEIIDQAFPYLRKRLVRWLEEPINEISANSSSPADLFKVLALPSDQVDEIAVFEVMSHLLIGDTAGPLDVRSKGADIRDRWAYWNDVFNEELFAGKYAEVEDYQLPTYHDSKTNAVRRFHSASSFYQHPQKGENFTIHEFVARRVKNFGLVYVNIQEENIIQSTIQALIAAASNGGIIRPVEDVKGSMVMTFVDLGDKTGMPANVSPNTPRLPLLKRKVMEVMIKHMQIQRVVDVSPEDQRPSVFYTKDSSRAPIKLRFMNRKDYLNEQVHVGEEVVIDGFPEPIYNGKAEKLESLRGLLPLVGRLFPSERYHVNAQTALLGTIHERAGELIEDCTSQINHFGTGEH